MSNLVRISDEQYDGFQSFKMLQRRLKKKECRHCYLLRYRH